MKFTFFLRLVLLNTFKKKLRASLVIGGIAVTSSVMIVLFGVGIGMRAMANAEINRADSKGVITVDERNISQIKLDQEKLSKIKSISGVGQVESSVGLAGNVVYHGIGLSLPVYGVSKDYFAVSRGQSLAGDPTSLGGDDVLVSSKVLQAWGLTPANAIGKTMTANVTIPKTFDSHLSEDSFITPIQTFTIVGVLDKGTIPVAYFPLDGLQSAGVDSVSQLKVRLSDPSHEPEVRESIEQMGFQTSSIQDALDQINKVFVVIHKTLVAFGVIVFFVTVSGTFTIISLTLMEEVRQIGFLRISGLKNSDVKILFITQSILLTVMGAVCGIIAGTLSGEMVNQLARTAAEGETFSVPVSIFAVPGAQIAAVLVLAFVIGWLVGLFPARRAVTIKPLEELRL